MPSAPMKIRCYHCGQLLGVSRSKAGRVISCPKCSSELSVPGLDALDIIETEKPETANETPGSVEDLGFLEKLPDEAPIDFESIAAPAAPALEPSEIYDPPADALAIGIKIPAIRVESPRARSITTASAKSATGNRDLLIPRSVVAAWSLLVLAALMFAFLTGLLAGHFIWREH